MPKSPKKLSKASEPPEALIFESYELKDLRAMNFLCRHKNDMFTVGINFHEDMPADWATEPPTTIIMGLGMAVISHVWTGMCCPEIIVRAGYLTDEEVLFWQDTYTRGLAEHFMINQIEDLGGGHKLCVEIRVDAPPPPAPPPADAPAGAAGAGSAEASADASTVRCLVPLGGGKDSSTVLELVKRAGCQAVVPFFLSDPEGEFADSWRYEALCDLAQCERVIVADFAWPAANWRQHQRVRKSTPAGAKWDDSARLWAALVAFAAALAARMRGCGYVAVGNERSANLGNGVSWGGHSINHQFDKSHTFERTMHHYLMRQGGPYLFSALQPLWDLQVVELVRCLPATR